MQCAESVPSVEIASEEWTLYLVNLAVGQPDAAIDIVDAAWMHERLIQHRIEDTTSLLRPIDFDAAEHLVPDAICIGTARIEVEPFGIARKIESCAIFVNRGKRDLRNNRLARRKVEVENVPLAGPSVVAQLRHCLPWARKRNGKRNDAGRQCALHHVRPCQHSVVAYPTGGRRHSRRFGAFAAP